MKALWMIANGVTAVSTLICLCLLLLGLGYLVVGRSPHGPAVHGKGSRKIGLAYIGQGVAAFAIWAVLFEAFDWGITPRSLEDAVAQSVMQAIAALLIFLGAAFLTHRWAREFAKGMAAQAEVDTALEEQEASPQEGPSPTVDTAGS